MGTEMMHVMHPIGDALGIPCTACGHPTRSHYAVKKGVWKCNSCGSRCYSVFG